MTILVQTNKRGAELPKRVSRDAYYTPIETVHRCLSVVRGNPKSILDPAAGEGVWGRAARERWPEARIWGGDTNPELQRPWGYDGWVQGDLRTCWQGFGEGFSLIATNPPYSSDMARQSVEALLPLLAFGGQLLLLLRLSFLEGIDRSNNLFKHSPPEAVYVLGRVNFTGLGNASPYPQALVCWRQGHQGETALRWLPAERKKKPHPRA